MLRLLCSYVVTFGGKQLQQLLLVNTGDIILGLVDLVHPMPNCPVDWQWRCVTQFAKWIKMCAENKSLYQFGPKVHLPQNLVSRSGLWIKKRHICVYDTFINSPHIPSFFCLESFYSAWFCLFAKTPSYILIILWVVFLSTVEGIPSFCFIWPWLLPPSSEMAPHSCSRRNVEQSIPAHSHLALHTFTINQVVFAPNWRILH